MTDQVLAQLVSACPRLLPDNIEGCDHAKGNAFVQAVAETHRNLDQIDLQNCPDVTDASLAILAAGAAL